MNANNNIFGVQSNEWTIYLAGILVFVVLFFVQKYAYKVDRELNKKLSDEAGWEGKPWPLISGLLLGFIVFVFGVFLPGDLSINPALWKWPEILVFVLALAIIVGLAIESFAHFGIAKGGLRIVIFGLLAIVFFYAGMIVGLLFAAILALVIIIYFLFFWKKRLGIS